MYQSIESFLSWARAHTVPEILEIADAELQRLETFVKTGKTTPEKQIAGKYFRQLREVKIYLGAKMRPGSAEQSDMRLYHSLVENLAKAGLITGEELATFPKS